jgi:hypothetical protein
MRKVVWFVVCGLSYFSFSGGLKPDASQNNGIHKVEFSSLRCVPDNNVCRRSSDCCTGNCENSFCTRPRNALDCGLPGEQAEQSWFCCSNLMVNGLCLGGNGFPARAGTYCTDDRQCESANCRENLCAGNENGRACSDDSECLSGRCLDRKCSASRTRLSPYGYPCLDSSDCLSKLCLDRRCR